MDHPLTDHLEFLNDICQWSRGRRKIFLEREISETLIAFIVEGIYNVLKAFCQYSYQEESGKTKGGTGKIYTSKNFVHIQEKDSD